MHYFSNSTLNIDFNYSNDMQNPDSSDNNLLILQQPVPLNEEDFEKIIAQKTLENIDDEYFQQLFNKSKTEADLALLLPEALDNNEFIGIANNSLEITIQNIINNALDGHGNVSYNLLFQLCDFNQNEQLYIANDKDEKQIQETLPNFIAQRFANIPYMFQTTNFINHIATLNTARAKGGDGLHMVDAQNLYQDAQGFENLLTPAQKAKMYYLQSEVFRKANIMPNTFAEPPACEGELNCLQLALNNTDDYKIVSCCFDRFKKQTTGSKGNLFEKNINNLIEAYKRVLENSSRDDILYHSNQKIAALYFEKTRLKSITKYFDAKDRANLNWSAFYLKQAYKNAPQNDCIATLNNMLEIYTLLNNKSMIFNVKKQRIKHLPPQDSINALIDLAIEAPDKFSDKEIKGIWSKLKKSKIPTEGKVILGQKYVDYLPRLTKDKEYINQICQTVNRQKANIALFPSRKKKSR